MLCAAFDWHHEPAPWRLRDEPSSALARGRQRPETRDASTRQRPRSTARLMHGRPACASLELRHSERSAPVLNSVFASYANTPAHAVEEPLLDVSIVSLKASPCNAHSGSLRLRRGKWNRVRKPHQPRLGHRRQHPNTLHNRWRDFAVQSHQRERLASAAGRASP